MAKRSPPRDRYDDVPLSALLQSARRTYSEAVRREQASVGCEDLPGTGSHLLSAMHWSGASLEAVIRWLGVTKQAVGQSVDLLVLRGYLERARDPSDRRRVVLSLTSRGRKAGTAAQRAIERVDRRLRQRIGPRKIDDTRATLIELLEMGRRSRANLAPDLEVA